MLEVLLCSVLLVALAVALLSVRLFVGKRFVHTHIDGNKALGRQGITCVKDMERRERKANPLAVKERE